MPGLIELHTDISKCIRAAPEGVLGSDRGGDFL